MKLLYIAYKIEKNKGSEDGPGYHVAELLTQHMDQMTIISRRNNIEKLKQDPAFARTRLISVDVPKILYFYKKKGRGIILYYYLWQVMVGLMVRKMQKQQQFDVIHQMNFHATWAPHFIFSKTARIIWGPLTQHPSIPLAFWYDGKKALLGEWAKRVVKAYFLTLDPFLKWAIRRSHRIILGQEQVTGAYNAARSRIVTIPQARSCFPVAQGKTVTEAFTILFIGRFISLKGIIPALQAIEQFRAALPQGKRDQVKTIIIGEGPLEQQIKRFDHVEVLPWQEQSALLHYYQQASVFLFPSFEGQGLVVAEALSQGCPVLCLRNTGPHSVAGNAALTVSAAGKDQLVKDLANQLHHLSTEYWQNSEIYQHYVQQSLTRAAYLTWPRMTQEVMEQYHG